MLPDGLALPSNAPRLVADMASGDRSAAALPAGTVTLVFADVEGSTRLVHALGERYSGVRTRMKEVVGECAARWNGHEVDWAGDGVFLAFSGARDALAAAAEMQRALAAEPWPSDGVLRVRMGIHTGEPDRHDHGYIGLDVHVAARICAAGHGDQIVVSQATHDVAGDEPAAGLSFRPLGRHRLKDVAEPQQLFQLVGAGLVADFPPLRTLAGATLPALHHRLVGRASDLAAVQTLLTQPEVRIVTITGPGGAGKSRLALEVAGTAAVHRPVHLVGLAPISDSELVPAAIARAVGVRESPGRTLLESVGEALAETGSLILLDNLEHLPGAAEHVRALLDAVPDVKLLITSRVPLRLAAERVVPLAPLPVDDASTLFSELAAARGVVLHPEALASVREICRRLDGLPLAIELVAARLVVLPPAHILEALDEGLALQMEGPVDLPARQRTLRATIDWSYSLLNERQRELHGTLAVFAGGCSLDDARAIAPSASTFFTDLEALVMGSLLRSDPGGAQDVRLTMLETVREIALSRLEEAGSLAAAQQQHAERFLKLASLAENGLAGSLQADWLARLERELDNLRAALDWCLGAGRVEDALRALAALNRFWHARGHVTEARSWFARALALSEDVPGEVRADALWTAAHQADAQSDWEAALPLLEEALVLFRQSGRGREASFALSELGFIALMQGDSERAATLCEEALALGRELGDARATSAALNNLGEVRSTQGDHERAIAHHEEAAALRRELGDALLVSASTYSLGVAAFRSGDMGRARKALEESLSFGRQLGESLHVAAQLFRLAELDLFDGEIDLAEERILESLAVYADIENDRESAECVLVLAAIEAARGSFEEAARLLGAAEALRGTSTPEVVEADVFARFEPDLRSALSADTIAGLRRLGAEVGYKALLAKVVPAGARE